MPLRPIDAIFVNPKEYCYVVYHKGALYKLVRMKLDLDSWQRRMRYSGSKEQIFLLSDQTVSDPKLANILCTLDFPKSLHGKSYNVFIAWWKFNSYQWSKKLSENNQSDLTQPNQSDLEDSNDKKTKLLNPEQMLDNTGHVKDDFFDSLLDQLNE